VVGKLSAEFPGLGYVWNVVRTETLAKPELAGALQIMTDIGIQGSRFIMANPDEAAAILHERLRSRLALSQGRGPGSQRRECLGSRRRA
jgi:hypothetical protein